MTARYLVRIDDVCPTMNWRVWDRIEAVMAALGVTPILAVVPDNRDPNLEADAAAPDFWQRVRSWQDRGWTIGMHGYQHRYVTNDPGVIGLNARSEFAGLPADEQEEKIRRGMSVFREHDVSPEVWVAPAHSFDKTTVDLVARAGIRIISDGLSLLPYVDATGVMWIPQQLWRFRPVPVGVWTVCCHPNRWTVAQVSAFSNDLERYRSAIRDVRTTAEAYRHRTQTWIDRLTTPAVRWTLALRGRRRERVAAPSPPDASGGTGLQEPERRTPATERRGAGL